MSDRLERAFASVREQYRPDPEYVQAVTAALELPGSAEDDVVAREIIGRLPNRLVHEVRNAWTYRESEVTPLVDLEAARADPTATLHWYDRADEAKVTVEPLGNPVDYDGFDPVEDVALAPSVRWTDADKKAAMEKAIKTYGLEPGQWIDVDWPPTAYLTDPGHVYTTEFESCPRHQDTDDASCADCEASVREVVETNAQWKWTAPLEINEIRFDEEGEEYDKTVWHDRDFAVAVTEQDPREVLIGPPGQGRYW